MYHLYSTLESSGATARDFKRCSLCKSRWFCSARCQKEGFSSHREDCRRIIYERDGYEETALMPGMRNRGHLKNQLSTFIDYLLMHFYLPSAMVQAFSFIPSVDSIYTPLPGGPDPKTHTIWLHFTYDPKKGDDLLRAFTLTQGGILPHAEMNDHLDRNMDVVKHYGDAPDSFSQRWLNEDMKLARAPSDFSRFPYAVSATFINAREAASGYHRQACLTGGQALGQYSVPADIGFPIPPADRWFKDLKGKLQAARTPLSEKKLTARKEQAAKELGKLNHQFGNSDAHLWQVWSTRSLWHQYYLLEETGKVDLSSMRIFECHGDCL